MIRRDDRLSDQHQSDVVASQSTDRWVDQQLFEEDIRAVLRMMRPHRREHLLGWAEYRTGGAAFRVTVAWDETFPRECELEKWHVPRIVEVLESLLVGAARDGDELSPQDEFGMYRQVVRELSQRIDELESCYT